MDAIQLRQLMLATLDELGLGDVRWLGQRLLFRERYYIGARYDFEGVSAIWLAEAGEVRFIDEEGRVLKVVAAPAMQGGLAGAA